MMKQITGIDGTLAAEIRQAKGDKSRAALRDLNRSIHEAATSMSTPNIMNTFGDCIKSHGRVAVAVSLAQTIMQRADEYRSESWLMRWADSVLECYQPNDPLTGVFNDGLHSSRLMQYAGGFIRMTSSY